MKIGLVSFHSFLHEGGVKSHILGLFKEFRNRGLDVKIIVPRRTRKENYGKDIILLGTSFPLHLNGSQSDFCVNFNPAAIDEMFKREKFDVLHFHNCGLLSSYQIVKRSQSLNVLTMHADVRGSNFLKSFPIFLNLLEKTVQWKCDGIIGVAPFNLYPFKNYSGPKIVIPNGIDIAGFSPQAPKIKKFSDGKINILFVGRIERRKGLIYLLKAYKKLTEKFSDLRMIIVGDGDLRQQCQRFVRVNRLAEVYFEGEIAGPELASYYATADIFASPAIFGESFGIVLLEAMASGTPVAAFANRGYKEFLKGKGEQSLTAPTAKALAGKIEQLILNPRLRKQMGEWGIEESKNYAWPKIAGQILDFYSLCQRRKYN